MKCVCLLLGIDVITHVLWQRRHVYRLIIWMSSMTEHVANKKIVIWSYDTWQVTIQSNLTHVFISLGAEWYKKYLYMEKKVEQPVTIRRFVIKKQMYNIILTSLWKKVFKLFHIMFILQRQMTPLLYAANVGHLEIVKCLVEYGSDKEARETAVMFFIISSFCSNFFLYFINKQKNW